MQAALLRHAHFGLSLNLSNGQLVLSSERRSLSIRPSSPRAFSPAFIQIPRLTARRAFISKLFIVTDDLISMIYKQNPNLKFFPEPDPSGLEAIKGLFLNLSLLVPLAEPLFPDGLYSRCLYLMRAISEDPKGYFRATTRDWVSKAVLNSGVWWCCEASLRREESECVDLPKGEEMMACARVSSVLSS